VVTRSQSCEVRHKVEASLEARGVPLKELRLLEDRAQLRSSIPLRGDLRETSFSTYAMPSPKARDSVPSMLTAGLSEK